jgi:hypothetical protein
MLTVERIKEAFNYNPETGDFTWKIRTAHRIKIGDKAGCVAKPHGYVLIRLDNILVPAQRLVFMMDGIDLTGMEVDHIDGNPSNNSRSNLRVVTHHQNMRNSKKRRSTFTSKWKGVSKAGNKWAARIYVNGENIIIGRYSDEREAAEEYMFAALEHFGEYARLQ